MKRILVSFIGGIILPILLTFLAGFAAAFVNYFYPQYNLMDMQVKGQASPGLIFAPIAIPFWIYDYIRFYNYFGLKYVFDTVCFRTTWTISFNFLFYTGITYLLLWHFNLLDQSKTIAYSDPPKPPQF